MHGPPLLENPIVPVIMVGVSFVFLYFAIWRKGKSKDSYNVQPKIAGHKVLDTGDRWILFTFFIGLLAFGAHFMAEYVFHIYDITPVDRITHGISGMAIAAFVLNFNLTRGRRVYYPASIGVSWLAFIAWEIYEWISVMTDPNTIIQTGPWDLAIDLWVDTLGALAICFIHDEFMANDEQQ